MSYRRKLIEVALPLEAINKESAREKSIRHGHPSTLHLWWARRPLAACRAVLFSSLVDDPSEYMPDEDSANAERERLFKIIEDLVLWENINNEEVLDKAKLEIARSVARDLGVDVPVGKQAIREFLATQAPPVLDPFAGGGSIPLEAQRLGLRAYASDLNPVAVLINKALIEIPPKFAGMPPVHPMNSEELSETGELPSSSRKKKKGQQIELWQREWKGAEGLAEDVRYYGQWMRDEAFKRIGHLYPPVMITEEILAERPDLTAKGLKPGDELTVIAWLWARTVKCPNPACGCQMPLVRSFSLSIKNGKKAWVEPVIDHNIYPPGIHFKVTIGIRTPPEGTVNRNGARCVVCGTPVSLDYVRAEGLKKQLGACLTSIVVDSKYGGRIYLPAQAEHEMASTVPIPIELPDTDLPERAIGFSPQLYGMNKHRDLFTHRQLNYLSVLTELVIEVYKLILSDTKKAGFPDDYSNAITTYLGMGVSKLADYNSSLVIWSQSRDQAKGTFARQVLPIVWDYCEVNPFAEAAGDFKITLHGICEMLDRGLWLDNPGKAVQADATQTRPVQSLFCISTDPPYYDNVPYANLSDFFYIWLRKSLGPIYPDIFGTLLVPKTSELVADPFRHGSRDFAQKFFEDGLTKVFEHIFSIQEPSIPTTVFYAFRQAEEDDENDIEIVKPVSIVSTGWETILEGLIRSRFVISGTWPMRTERSSRSRSIGSNALASSIILVCRPRPESASFITRRGFLADLKRELPPALRQLQQGSIAPVDLAQAAIGPGMAVFSRYKQVLEADGSQMRVRTALGIINQALDEFLAEQEGEYDGDTRWALAWYEQYGHEQGPYGVAETLSKAKNTSVVGAVEAGILEARAGKVRLLRRDELDKDWDPQKDKRPTAWEACQHLIFELDKNGEQAAAGLLAQLGGLSETARDLAYRLYTICERKGWAQDALGYNMLVVAWPRLRELARGKAISGQDRLL